MKRIGKIGIAGAAAAAAALYVAPAFFPLPEKLTAPLRPGLEFVDRQGRPLRQLLAGDLRLDEPAAFAEIPEHLIHATLAAEDQRFFSHNGIDFLGVARAIRDGLLRGRVVSGASTITQQLIKITSPPRRRGLEAKVIEVFSARKLEMHWTKQRILAAYLNRLPYGNQFTGCRAAARGYFGKPLADLSVAEAAFLAGLPNKPSRLNPYRRFDAAKKRQLWVLERMRAEGWIDEKECEAARNESLRIAPEGDLAFGAPHFVELLLQQETGRGLPEAGKVRTSLDLDLQRFVESAIDSGLQALDQRVGRRLSAQSAAVVIENATGAVRALAGSRDFFDSESGQVNGAWALRSPGSTLKPFTYLLALERGYTAATVLADLPVEYITPGGAYQPVNYDRGFRGPVPLREALACSLNVPAVRVLDDLGGAAPLHRLLTSDLGLTGLDPEPGKYGLGLTLGNAEVRLLELANAYACLARLGRFRPFRLTEEETQQGQVRESTLFDEDACWILADILSDNRARSAAFGLHSSLRFPWPVACKTGTSTDYRDNWTIGFTPEYTVGVWVGQFDNQPLQNVSGVNGAGLIFHAVMEELFRDSAPGWYPRPESVVRAEVDSLTGKRLTDDLPVRPGQSRTEWFRRGRLPSPAQPSDYDSDGRTLLPPSYGAWFASGSNSLGKVASVRKPGKGIAAVPLHIVSPMSGTVAYLDPDLPDGGRRFPLEIEGGAGESIEWSSETLSIEKTREQSWLILRPGRHRVTAADPETGRTAETEITVESL